MVMTMHVIHTQRALCRKRAEWHSFPGFSNLQIRRRLVMSATNCYHDNAESP